MAIFTSSRFFIKSLGILALMCLFCIKTYALNVTYYINATTGNDTNNGTSTDTPWATIGRANTQNLEEGDKILFNSDGPWHNGPLKFNANDIGTSVNPIVVDSYGTNPRAKIYGNDT